MTQPRTWILKGKNFKGSFSQAYLLVPMSNSFISMYHYNGHKLLRMILEFQNPHMIKIKWYSSYHLPCFINYYSYLFIEFYILLILRVKILVWHRTKYLQTVCFKIKNIRLGCALLFILISSTIHLSLFILIIYSKNINYKFLVTSSFFRTFYQIIE